MKYMRKLNFAALLLTLPALSFAHTGHGVLDGASMIHYLLSPMHAIPVGIALVGTAIYFWRKKRAASK